MKKVHLTFTIEETNTVLQALLELPGKIGNPISENIVKQAREEEQAEKDKEKEEQAMNDPTDV